MIVDPCGSREIKVDILQLLAKVKKNNAPSSFFFVFFFYIFLPPFLEAHMKCLRKNIEKN